MGLLDLVWCETTSQNIKLLRLLLLFEEVIVSGDTARMDED